MFLLGQSLFLMLLFISRCSDMGACTPSMAPCNCAGKLLLHSPEIISPHPPITTLKTVEHKRKAKNEIAIDTMKG
jgi:hypothetical protein